MSKQGDNIYLTFDGKPVPQSRPRARRMGNHATVYEDKKSKDAKQAIIAKLHQTAHLNKLAEPFFSKGVPVEVCVEFYFEIPKSRQTNTVPGDSHIIKPDIDNLVKLVLDAITKSGVVWHDDSQVAEISAKKRYGVNPETHVYIEHSID